ncbi:MAG: histidine kinase [Chitinophagales bacterium]
MLSILFVLTIGILCIFSCENSFSPSSTSVYEKDSITHYIDSLNEVSWSFRNANKDSLKYYAEIVITESEKINYFVGLGEGYSKLGFYEKAHENYKSALENYRKSLFYRLKTDSAQLIAKSYSMIGVTYKDSAVYDSSIYYHNKSILIADSIKSYIDEAKYLMNMGVTHDKFLNFRKAIGFYMQALHIWESLHLTDTIEIFKIYNNLGSGYYSMRQYDSSLLFIDKVIEKSKTEALDHYVMAVAYNNAGLNYQALDQPDSAMYYYKNAIQFYEAAGNNRGKSTALSNLGILCMEQKKFSECLKYLLESSQLALKEGNIEQLAENYPYIGDYYLQNNNPALASKYYVEAIQYDSTLRESTDKQIRSYADIQTQFIETKSEKEKQEILLKQKQKELILKIIIGSAIASIIILLLLFNRRQLRKKIEYQKKLAQDRTRISSDLHDDIGAALSSISMYSDVVKMQVENKDFEEANNLLTEIASTSRELMDHMSDLVWAINPKNDNFEKIIQRSKSFAHRILQSKNIQLQFSAPDHLEDINMPMEVRHNLFMIYKEAINNAAKYSNATLVKMEIIRNEKNIISKISDNGTGFEMHGEKEGNGLKNMKRRAGEIAADFSMLSQLGEGTQIEVIYNIAV